MSTYRRTAYELDLGEQATTVLVRSGGTADGGRVVRLDLDSSAETSPLSVYLSPDQANALGRAIIEATGEVVLDVADLYARTAPERHPSIPTRSPSHVIAHDAALRKVTAAVDTAYASGATTTAIVERLIREARMVSLLGPDERKLAADFTNAIRYLNAADHREDLPR